MMNRNFAALHEFKDFWRSSSDVTHLPTGDMIFDAKIGYDSANRIAVERSRVRIALNGFNEGRIDIDESGELTAEDFHLRFEPKFQHYTFDEDNGTLVVEGASPKMGGEYAVRIHPR